MRPCSPTHRADPRRCSRARRRNGRLCSCRSPARQPRSKRSTTRASRPPLILHGTAGGCDRARARARARASKMVPKLRWSAFHRTDLEPRTGASGASIRSSLTGGSHRDRRVVDRIRGRRDPRLQPGQSCPTPCTSAEEGRARAAGARGSIPALARVRNTIQVLEMLQP